LNAVVTPGAEATMVVLVDASAANSVTAMVVYDAIAAAATLAGIEFDTTSRILRFGSVTPRLLEFSIPIMEDADVEMDESLTISLSDVRVNGVEITASPSFVTTRLRD